MGTRLRLALLLGALALGAPLQQAQAQTALLGTWRLERLVEAGESAPAGFMTMTFTHTGVFVIAVEPDPALDVDEPAICLGSYSVLGDRLTLRVVEALCEPRDPSDPAQTSPRFSLLGDELTIFDPDSENTFQVYRRVGRQVPSRQ